MLKKRVDCFIGDRNTPDKISGAHQQTNIFGRAHRHTGLFSLAHWKSCPKIPYSAGRRISHV